MRSPVFIVLSTVDLRGFGFVPTSPEARPPKGKNAMSSRIQSKRRSKSHPVASSTAANFDSGLVSAVPLSPATSFVSGYAGGTSGIPLKSNESESHTSSRCDPASCAPSLSGAVDAILEIGSQRHVLLTQLRAALESNRKNEALSLSRRLCGLDYEKGNRTHSRIN